MKLSASPILIPVLPGQTGVSPPIGNGMRLVTRLARNDLITLGG